MRQAAGIFNDKIGAGAFLRIGHLPCQNTGQFLFGHSWPGHCPLPLKAFIGGNNNHIIKFPLLARFKEKRNVEDNKRSALLLPMADEIVPAFF